METGFIPTTNNDTSNRTKGDIYDDGYNTHYYRWLNYQYGSYTHGHDGYGEFYMLHVYPEYPNVRDYPNVRVAIETFRALFDVIMPGVILGVGVVTNLLNLIIFHRHCFHGNHCTPSLLSMAASDMVYCVFTLFQILGKISKDRDPPLGYDVINNDDVRHVIWTFSHVPGVISSRFSEWITAYLAVERMMAVTFFTFEIKWLFEPRRSYVTISIILALTLLSHVHMFVSLEYSYATIQRGVWYLPDVDQVYIGLVNMNIIYGLFFFHENIFEPTCIILVFILTVITILRLSLVKPLKDDAMHTALKTTTTQATDREQPRIEVKNEIKLVKLSITMCIFFLLCYFPALILCYVRYERFTRIDHARFVSFVLDLYYELQAILLPFLKTVYASCKVVIYVSMDASYRRDITRVCLVQK